MHGAVIGVGEGHLLQVQPAAKPKPQWGKKEGQGADERIAEFRTAKKENWWCRRDGGEKREKGQVTRGEREAGRNLFLSRSQTGEKRHTKCAIQATLPDTKPKKG
jgi:hypothetical protein